MEAPAYEYAAILEDVEPVGLEEIEALAAKQTAKQQTNVVKASKGLSAVLRHDKKGKILRRDGWALLEKLRCSETDAMRAVLDNNKERFAVGRGVKTKKVYLRAKQGHSIPVELGLKRITDPKTIAYHGTTREAWHLIEHAGLSKMKRQVIVSS